MEHKQPMSYSNLKLKDGENKLKIVDLFAGVGGLSLGALRAGFDLELAVEFDKHALSTHKLNFPHVNHLKADINNIDGKTILKACGPTINRLDGVIGGPPCQGFSQIGRRRVLDPRNDLFVKFFEIVGQVKPRFYLAENVLGILNERYQKIREKAIDHLSDEYVVLPPIKLKASDFGAATSRERVFFIGYLQSEYGMISIEDFTSMKVRVPTVVKEAFHGLPKIQCEWQKEVQSWQALTEEVPSNSDFWKRISDFIPNGVGDSEAIRRYVDYKEVSGCFGTQHSVDVEARYAKLKHGQRDTISKSVRLDPNNFCPTLRAGTGPDKGSYQAVRPIHPSSPRVITPREAARLQGFPDWFQFSPTKWHSFRQIGNSVSPILAEAILLIIKQRLQI